MAVRRRLTTPITDERVINAAGERDHRKEIAGQVEESAIESVNIRSVLTCETKRGICAKCYGRNLATGRMVQRGEAVGVIAAQSIGEPGTQLTLRTFHVGDPASDIAVEASLKAKFNGIIEFEDIRTVGVRPAPMARTCEVVMGRSGEVRIVEPKDGPAYSSATTCPTARSCS